MAYELPQAYNAPHAAPSTIGKQVYIEFLQKKALVEAAKEAYFGQMADTTNMPKHFGKTIKVFHYMPILDDRNINDQGIDAQSVSVEAGFIANKTIAKHVIIAKAPNAEGGMYYYFEGAATGAAAAAAKTASKAIADGKLWAFWNSVMGGTAANAAAAPTAMTAAGWVVTPKPAGKEFSFGNMYGSSKDVGTIVGKMPALGEHGGRVNRVGMTRVTLEGAIENFGFFEEYTEDSIQFDNDMELESHITTEAVKAANEITEDQIQIDLLNGAGVIRYAGTATSTATIRGSTAAELVTAGAPPDVITYDDLVKLSIELDNNRTPKNTKLITGSRMIDTKVVNAARYMYVGSELLPTFMRMKDYHDQKAWIPVAQYGAADTIARGEQGAVADFRIIVVPEMMHWDAAGAAVATPADQTCYWTTDSAGAAKVNVYPCLVVGDGAFTTIGFQTDGKEVKFRTKHVKPGSPESYSREDPYGKTGYYSTQWWYGSLVLRPERLALIKTAAIM